jgi:DNA polymerase
VLTVTLGRHSLNCFLPDLSISQVHGQPKRYKGRVYLPLFHPAAALYNGAMRQTLIDDFALIPTIIQKIKSS